MKHVVHLPIVPPKATAQGSAMILHRHNGQPFIHRSASSPGAKAKQTLLTLLAEQRPKEPFAGPLSVRVRWVYPWRSATSKRVRALGSVPCTTRPDIDNLCKLLFDAATQARYWQDDSQITELTFSKAWGNEVGITMEIETNTQGETRHD